jgi:hypothetical protein
MGEIYFSEHHSWQFNKCIVNTSPACFFVYSLGNPGTRNEEAEQ